MKYGIIIQDLDRDQVDEVLAKLDGEHATITSTGNEGEFDSKGMPWDERIHASTKTQNKDGSWKKKKGVDDATIAAVEGELRLTTAQATAPAMPTAPVAPSAVSNTLDRLEQQMAAPSMPVAPSAPAMPTAPVAPSAPVAPAAMPAPAPAAIQRDFAGLMTFISGLYRRPNPPQHDYGDTIVARINQGFNISTVTTITDIADQPAYVEYAWACVDVDIKAGLIKA